eukprot:6199867-Pleurochrysis_carterae.AAC.3
MSAIRVQRLDKPSMPDIESEHERELIQCASCGCICQEQPLSMISGVDPQAAVGRTLERDKPLVTRECYGRLSARAWLQEVKAAGVG